MQCETRGPRGQLLDNPNVEGQLHEGGARHVCVWESSEYQQWAWGCGPQRLIPKKVPESGGAWGCWSQLLGSLNVPEQLLERCSQKLGRHWDMLREELLLLCKTMFLRGKHNVNKVLSHCSRTLQESRLKWSYQNVYEAARPFVIGQLQHHRATIETGMDLTACLWLNSAHTVITEINFWKGLATGLLIRWILTFQIPYKFPVHW